jgi:nucleoside phosphorylase
MVLLVAATEPELCGLDGVVCGVGPVEAAARTAEALVERQPPGVLHIGLAGARDLDPLAVVLGSEAIYCDTDSALVPSRALPDERLLAAARHALPDALVMPIGTSARVGGTTGCRVEAMEGFAVLRAAAIAGVPALEARIVSNAIDEPDRAKWRFDDSLAALADVLPRLLAALSQKSV